MTASMMAPAVPFGVRIRSQGPQPFSPSRLCVCRVRRRCRAACRRTCASKLRVPGDRSASFVSSCARSRRSDALTVATSPLSRSSRAAIATPVRFSRSLRSVRLEASKRRRSRESVRSSRLTSRLRPPLTCLTSSFTFRCIVPRNPSARSSTRGRKYRAGDAEEDRHTAERGADRGAGRGARVVVGVDATASDEPGDDADDPHRDRGEEPDD